MKLGILSPDTADACFIYRCQPWKVLAKDVTVADGKKGFNLWQIILESDVVLMNRPFTTQQVEIAKIIKSCGKKLIVDWDDDLSQLPPWNPNRKNFDGCLPNLRALAQLADVVTVASKALEQTASVSFGAKWCERVPNAIDDTFKVFAKYPRNPIVVWRGSPTHSADLDAGRAKFQELNKTHEIVFVGDCPPWAYELKHRHFPVTDYAAYMVTLASLAPEFFFIPLADHPFNHARSDVGAMEAWAVHAKVIHSNLGDFAGLPESGEPRWTSDVNKQRERILRELCAISS